MSDTLPAVAEPIGLLFRINNRMVARGLDGLSDEAGWARIQGTGNPIAWVVAHITETRAFVLRLMGTEWATGWGDQFLRGAELGEPASYPALTEIRQKFGETPELLLAALARLSAEALAAPSPTGFAGAKTIADTLAFFAFHEAYHIGQVSYIRKQLGYTSLAG